LRRLLEIDMGLEKGALDEHKDAARALLDEARSPLHTRSALERACEWGGGVRAAAPLAPHPALCRF